MNRAGDDAKRSFEEKRRAMIRPITGQVRRREIGRVTVLTNPVSGRGNASHAAEKSIVRLRRRGVDVDAIVGSDAEHARRLLDSAVGKGTDALVVVGGDGAITDALQTLAGNAIPLGIIPAGTGNDHAREFGLPTKDPVAAADIVADGWTETVDLGRIRDRTGSTTWFGTVAAAGFDSLVTDRANRMRWPRGRMRYTLAMLAELSQLRLLPFRLVLDGRDKNVTDLTLVAFGNTRSYGGGMLICPHADHADGQLDITMVHSTSRTRLIRLFPTVYRGAHLDLDEVTTTRATSVDVESPGINAYADGDYACTLPANISAVSGALQILRRV
jgi:diacylglycerol kinase (ATP)